jgi:hypothetical protein
LASSSSPAATLHASETRSRTHATPPVALRPLAGSFGVGEFGAGLAGGALLAASILPLSTAYSVSEALGYEAVLDDSPDEAPVFY